MKNLSLEKRSILAFIVLPIPLLLVVGMFAYYSNTRLARVAEENIQTTQIFLEQLYEQTDDPVEVQQHLKTYLSELQEQKASFYALQRQSMLTFLVIFLNALILFLLIGFLFTRQIKKFLDQEKQR